MDCACRSRIYSRLICHRGFPEPSAAPGFDCRNQGCAPGFLIEEFQAAFFRDRRAPPISSKLRPVSTDRATRGASTPLRVCPLVFSLDEQPAALFAGLSAVASHVN